MPTTPPFTNIMTSPAYYGLLDIIRLIGDFVSSPLWFGISFIQLLAICFCLHFVIGILLGGIAPRSSLEKQPTVRYAKPETRLHPELLLDKTEKK